MRRLLETVWQLMVYLVMGALKEVTGLPRSAARGEVRYVALDPPCALRRGDEEYRLVPIMAFVGHLTGT